MNKKVEILVVVLAVLFGVSTASNAETLFSDDFDSYNDGDLLGLQVPGWYSWSGNGRLRVKNDAAHVIQGIDRNPDGSSQWGGAMHDLDNTSSDIVTATWVSRVSTNIYDMAYLQFFPTSGDPVYMWLRQDGGSDVDIVLDGGVTASVQVDGLSADTWYELKAEFDLDADKATASYRTIDGTWNTIGTTSLSTTNFELDELGVRIRMGGYGSGRTTTDYADVDTINIDVVPEPSVLALVMGMLVMLLGFRRR